LRRELAGYQVAPAQLAGLVELAGLRRSGVGGALLELPTLARTPPPPARTRAPPPTFRERGSPAAAPAGIAPFQLDHGTAIPDDGWADLGHLNRRGAAAYSGWLGARLAQAVRAPASSPILRCDRALSSHPGGYPRLPRFIRGQRYRLNMRPKDAGGARIPA